MPEMTEQQAMELAAKLQRSGQLLDAVSVYNDLGNQLADSGAPEKAAQVYRLALSIKPEQIEIQNNLGTVLLDLGQMDEALNVLRKAVTAQPDYCEAWNNLGNVLRSMGQIQPAIDAYRRAISLRPDWAIPHYSMGACEMLRGHFRDGWPLLEWRWRDRSLNASGRNIPKPMWDGSDLKSRTILLYSEQGFGDTIQFARYIPLVAALGGKVICGCPPELLRLMRSIEGVDHWITVGDPVPPFDVHCPIMSLPMVLDTTLDTIPNRVPYLKTDEHILLQWRERLKPYGNKLKIGIAWSGRPTQRHNRKRSIPFELLQSMLERDDVQFFGLQKGGNTANSSLIDWTGEFTDFSQTAGLIDNLDLVISIDSAIAHLAGALSRETWVMLAYSSDWRWMLGRDDSPWYPTMRLFRQPQFGDWPAVVRRVVQELSCRK
ncbi:MAG TPA: tetratricopeptide repeat protein [Tepidisphaeraceae bacterium]|nr:tetratricopeptide repeat protein [Tepidisphaeraceae bacterium]